MGDIKKWVVKCTINLMYHELQLNQSTCKHMPIHNYLFILYVSWEDNIQATLRQFSQNPESL